jgi:transcription initiation factor TFIIIB Brf1 subunit/transcription initiation factor TFIIB
MSQATTIQTEACPSCGATTVETQVYSFEGVCRACGFVIQEGSEPSVPGELDQTSGTTESESETFRSQCTITCATEKRLVDAFETIEEIADTLPISTQTRQTAVDIYLNAFRGGVTDGREQTTFVAACLQLASVKSEQVIPSSRLDDVEDVDLDRFHGYRQTIETETQLSLPTSTPIDYVWFLSATDVISDETEPLVRELLQAVSGNTKLVGKDPSGVAATAAYIVSDSLTQRAVATTVGVSIETIRRRSGVLKEAWNDD